MTQNAINAVSPAKIKKKKESSIFLAGVGDIIIIIIVAMPLRSSQPPISTNVKAKNRSAQFPKNQGPPAPPVRPRTHGDPPRQHRRRPPVPALQRLDVRWVLVLESRRVRAEWRAPERARLGHSVAHDPRIALLRRQARTRCEPGLL